MDRVWIHVAWRDNVKGVLERSGLEFSNTTPVMQLALTDQPERHVALSQEAEEAEDHSDGGEGSASASRGQ